MAKSKRPEGNGVAVHVSDPLGSGLPHVSPFVPANEELIVIRPPNIKQAHIGIIGVNPLIVNAFPDKVLRQFEADKEQEKPAGKRPRKALPARNYQKEYEDSLYPIDDGTYGFPSIAFKHAMVGACRQVEGLTMELAKRLIFVLSDARSKGAGVVRINGTPSMQRDLVRLSDMNKTPDVRFRGVFFPWSCLLRIEFNANLLSVEGICNLLQIAGRFEGVGENRPSSPKKTGDHGTFRIDEISVGESR